ncbi:MAG TPA: glycosyltransferase family 39 protein [Acidimicrobiales bacterium]|nr:glycosyltransferase family 39 protein [Acidimicrobiales bacterium]
MEATAVDQERRSGDDPVGAVASETEVAATDGGDGGLRGWWRTAVVVGVVVAVAAGLVLRFSTRSALWLDEALTVDIARQPLSHLHALLRRDGAPPLYYVLLHFWIAVFGTSRLAVRSLSGVLSVATLPIAWVAARRYAGRYAAWAVVVLLATAPFAVYYATESRMYALVMFLTACGFVAVGRAEERPRPGNLIAVAVVTAALLYTQYWSLYLIGALGVWFVWQAWRGDEAGRRAARWLIGAVLVGVLAFVPWVPTFVFQSRHTGTPWAMAPNFAALVNAVTGFTNNQGTATQTASDQGRLLSLIYLVVAGLALFGVARDRWHILLDLRTRPKARGLSFVVFVALVAAIGGAIATSSAFSPRYAAIVFVPFIILVGFGTLAFADVKLRTAILAVAAVAGLGVAVENVWTQRTQATMVASVIATHARPGDLVAYCPDQLGPSVYRLLPGGEFQQVTFPRRTSPEFVNWVDYKAAVQAADPTAFAHHLQQRAGSHNIWLAWAPNYEPFGTRCEQLATTLLDTPGWGGHQWVYLEPKHYYEPMELTQFAPLPAAASGR